VSYSAYGLWDNGDDIAWADEPPYLVGTARVVAAIRTELSLHRTIPATPTGPAVPSRQNNLSAVMAAADTVAPGCEWEGDLPDHNSEAPEDAVF